MWDPRSPQSGDFFGTDFTCSSSMPDVLAALRSSDGYSERLALAVTQDDLREAQRLLGSADVTPALHLALKIGASPETVDLLATCCEHLNVWLPEPVVVTWARASCRAALECSTKRCHSASGATGRLDALLWAGADVNAVGRGCETALHIVARMLQLLRQERGYGCAIKNEFQVARELRKLWHNLVARGADASMVDGEGFSAVERCDFLAQDLQGRKSTAGAPRWAGFDHVDCRLCNLFGCRPWSLFRCKALAGGLTPTRASPVHSWRSIEESWRTPRTPTSQRHQELWRAPVIKEVLASACCACTGFKRPPA